MQVIFVAVVVSLAVIFAVVISASRYIIDSTNFMLALLERTVKWAR